MALGGCEGGCRGVGAGFVRCQRHAVGFESLFDGFFAVGGGLHCGQLEALIFGERKHTWISVLKDSRTEAPDKTIVAYTNSWYLPLIHL